MGKKKIRLYVANSYEEGKIKKIIADKGYGYIEVADHNDAKFYIKDNKVLKEGDLVIFSPKESGEKTLAVNIKLKQGKHNSKMGKEETGLKQAYYLPNDTKNLVKEIKKQTNNFSLLINKFVSFVNVNGTKKAKLDIRSNISYSIISKILEKQEEAIKKLSLSVSNNFEMTTSWRLAVGLGNESVYETSMTLHHVYGIPYIPSFALKGIARSRFIINRIPENFSFEQKNANAKLEEFIIKNYPEFRDLFGNPKVDDIKEQSGKVVFFDSFPIEIPTVVEDIMTPHYSEYYGNGNNKIPPGDYFMPTPINFPVVKNTTFKFYIGIKSNVYEEKAKELLEKASYLLNDALINNGIGAKTAVGYGYFK